MADEEYCKAQGCTDQVTPVTPENGMQIYLRSNAPDMGSTITPEIVGDVPLWIHRRCFSSARHVRA